MKLVHVVAATGVSIGIAAWLMAAELNPSGGFAVHEWGTFTTVAGRQGYPIEWAPPADASDLPCFVERPGPISGKVGYSKVRMETPVAYFYSKTPMTASVRVDFPSGRLTEWYPHASADSPNAAQQLRWDSLAIRPDAHPSLPLEAAPSHYYAARETDSAPVEAGGQWEKLLFYRGLGNFDVPVRVLAEGDGSVTVRKNGSGSLAMAVWFENRGGEMGYRLVRDVAAGASVRLAAPELHARLSSLRADLEASLVAAGLFPLEAHAMVETWRDAWFGPGSRVFYVMPRAAVDAVLPLHVTPRPERVERVFAGRVEVLTPWREARIRDAVAKGDASGVDEEYRFLRAFVDVMYDSRPDAAAQRMINDAGRRQQRELASRPACVPTGGQVK